MDRIKISTLNNFVHVYRIFIYFRYENELSFFDDILSMKKESKTDKGEGGER